MNGISRQAGNGLWLGAALLAATSALAAPGDVDTGAGEIPAFPVVRPDGNFYEIETGRITLWNPRATGQFLDRFAFFNPIHNDPARGWSVYKPALLLANGDLLLPLAGTYTGTPPGLWVSHLMRVAPGGQRAASFGTDGIVSLDDEDPLAPERQSRVIAGLQELPDGRILVLEAESSCELYDLSYGSTWAYFPWWDEYGECVGSPQSLLRLLPDGRPDTTFGSAGRAPVASGLGRKVFLARQDGAVIVGGAGRLFQLFGPSGTSLATTSLGFTLDTGVVLPDGGLIAVGTNVPTRLRVVHLGSDLLPDADYGGDSGQIVDLSGLLGEGRLKIGSAVLDDNGQSLYVHVDFTGTAPPGRQCTGIARIRLFPQPALDPVFGKGGYACLWGFASNVEESVLQRQPGGGLLLTTSLPGSIAPLNLRIHTDDSPGAGVIAMYGNSWQGMHGFQFTENAGEVAVTISREGGSSGSVTLQWATEATQSPATPGQDYIASGGTLSWQDGDASPRVIRVQVLDDSTYERTSESFVIRFSRDPTSAPAMLFQDTLWIGIQDNDPFSQAPPPVIAPPASPLPASGGGGGTFTIWSLMWLLAVWGARRGLAAMH